MHLPIPIRNPAYVRVFPVLRDPSVSRTTDDISVVHAALDGRFSRRDEASWIPTPGQILRFRMKRFFDVDLFEYSVTVESSDSTVDGSWFVESSRQILGSIPDLPSGGMALPTDDVLLTVTDCSANMRYFDHIAYGLAHKRLDRTHVVFSLEEDEEYLTNALKNIEHIIVYSRKIARFHEHFLWGVYPESLVMHEQIVRECERLLADESRRSLGDDVLAKLNREVSRFDSLNFSLAYDIESIEGNVENLESRIETLGATESRYFDNFVRKAKATLRSYEKAVSKNTLVKETVLESARRAAERESELRRARIDRDRVDHIKNIKELLGGFAVIEVFINGIAQAAVIFSFPDSVRTALESTDLLRMIFLSMFLVGYFARFLIVRRRGF